MMVGTIPSVFLMSKADKKPATPIMNPVMKEKPRDEVNNNAKMSQDKPYTREIVWKNVFIFAVLHGMALYGLYLYFTASKLVTMIAFWFFGAIGGLGITGGAHRLWAHRSYKARLPMRIILMLMQTMAHQNTIYEWVRDHRAHHKFVDTNADPHNATRGFFFSHMGWLVVRKHPDVLKRGKGIDMTDIINDPVVAFQKKYYYILMPIICFILPTWMIMHFCGENFKVAFFTTILRYSVSLHYTWLVNSAAHLWGNKPYNQFISPAENLAVSLATYGEGWHNYHHVFPWDYKAAELGNYRANLTTLLIDIFAALGLAYDLKTVPIDVVRKRSTKTGDGSWTASGNDHSHENGVWGWNDEDMKSEDKEATNILRKRNQSYSAVAS